MPEKNPTKKELADRVMQLAEELRKLREAPSQPPARTEGVAEGVAEGVVSGLGKMIPGLGKLIDMASQMPEFHDRLAAIDEEIKRRFKEQPLRRASAGIAGSSSRRRMGIPPSVQLGRPGRSTSASAGGARSSGKAVGRGKHRGPRPPRVHISPETPAQLPVDVFDEGDHLAILAEAPSLKLEHVTVSREGTVLLVSIDAPGRKGVQRIELPCQVAGKPRVSLANGVLKIHLRKHRPPEQ